MEQLGEAHGEINDFISTAKLEVFHFIIIAVMIIQLLDYIEMEIVLFALSL